MDVPRLGRNRRVEFNVTPLIDVVFLLIIFFLVSSHLAQQETQLEVALPTAASTRDSTSNLSPRVTINVLADGTLFLGSESAATDELAHRLQVEREQTSGDLEVRIRADRGLPYRLVEPLLAACAEARVWNVSFAVYEREATR